MEDTAPAPVESPAAAPATTDAPAPRNRSEAVTRAREAFKQALVARAEAAKTAPVEAPAPAETPAPVAETTPAASAEKPAEPAPAAPSPDMAAAIAKALQDAMASDRTRYETEQRAKTLESELKSERDRFAKLNEDPIRKAFIEGKTFEQVTQDIVDKKYEPVSTEELRFRELQEQVAQERAKREAIEKRFEAEDASKEHQRRLTTAKEKLTQSADKYPFVNALDWMHEQAVNLHRAREGEGVDLDTVFGELNAAAQGDLRRVIGSDAALKQLFSDETIKNRVLAVLGTAATPKPVTPAEQAVAAPKTPTPEGPKSIPTRKVGESGERVSRKAPTAEERRANAAAMFKRLSGK